MAICGGDGGKELQVVVDLRSKEQNSMVFFLVRQVPWLEMSMTPSAICPC